MTAPLLAAALLLLALPFLHRLIAPLARVTLRTLLGALALQLLALAGGLPGISLGVNLFNALVLGVLGAPGFGLLVLLSGG